MLFPTLEFALFFVVVFLVNWLTRPTPHVWKPAMLAASLYFYAAWNWRFVLLIIGSIAVNWVLANGVKVALSTDEAAARWWVRGGVAANLGLLGLFKYYDFFAVEASNRLAQVGIDNSLPVLELTLPVGISFFTFQAMSYVIDVGRRQIDTMELLDFAVYLSFFPQLVAGPIVRASEMAPQLAARPDPRYVRSSEAFRLIFAGLVKKVVVSSYLASEIVDDVFANPDDFSAAEVLVGVYGYAIQIYADFSGYTDIAIGVALLLGFRFPQNFDAPYTALSLQDFWRRWHMTLSSWLRDYLYIPLGGNRRGELLTYRNLMLTMVLGGLWHGASWNFVVWGAIHGVVLAIERFAASSIAAPSATLPAGARPVVRWLVTFHVVCFAWIFFRAETFTDALDVLGRLTAFGDGSGVLSPLLILVILLSIAAQFVPADLIEEVDLAVGRSGWITQGAMLGVGLVAVDVLGPDGVAPFIYFQF